MSMIPRCVVCDGKIDPYGRDGPACRTCEPAPKDAIQPRRKAA